MHFRVPSRAAAFGARGALRTFTTSPRLTSFHHPADSHYDVLKLPHDASESEIKKSVPDTLTKPQPAGERKNN